MPHFKATACNFAALANQEYTHAHTSIMLMSAVYSEVYLVTDYRHVHWVRYTDHTYIYARYGRPGGVTVVNRLGPIEKQKPCTNTYCLVLNPHINSHKLMEIS